MGRNKFLLDQRKKMELAVVGVYKHLQVGHDSPQAMLT